jgi:hypothetical protein
VTKAANIIRGKQGMGAPLKLTDISDALLMTSLKLRSKSSEALQNLYNNLMKIRETKTAQTLTNPANYPYRQENPVPKSVLLPGNSDQEKISEIEDETQVAYLGQDKPSSPTEYDPSRDVYPYGEFRSISKRENNMLSKRAQEESENRKIFDSWQTRLIELLKTHKIPGFTQPRTFENIRPSTPDDFMTYVEADIIVEDITLNVSFFLRDERYVNEKMPRLTGVVSFTSPNRAGAFEKKVSGKNTAPEKMLKLFDDMISLKYKRSEERKFMLSKRAAFQVLPDGAEWIVVDEDGKEWARKKTKSEAEKIKTEFVKPLTSKRAQKDLLKSEEKYFVLSDGERPTKIVFKATDAFTTKEPYIDSFDVSGNLVKSYKFENNEYTTDF